MHESERQSPTTYAPYFAREIYVNSKNQIIVDGRKVVLWGIRPTKSSWPARLRLLLRWRRVYVIPRQYSDTAPSSVTLFTGRGDLASYLIWSGDANAVSVAYAHVQIAAFIRKAYLALTMKGKRIPARK